MFPENRSSREDRPRARAASDRAGTYEIESHAEIVAPGELAQAGCDRVTLFVPLDGGPGVVVPDDAQTGVEIREAALTRVGPVRAGNPERVTAERRTEVGRAACLILPVAADTPVNQHRRAESPCVADRRDVVVRVAASAAFDAQFEQIRHLRLQRRKFGKQLMATVAVPVDLDVVVVAIGFGRPRQLEVVLQSAVRARRVGCRVERLDAFGDITETTGRDHCARELRSPGAIGIPGCGIEQPEVRIHREHFTEVTVAHLRRRHGVSVEAAATFVVAFPGRKVKQLVPLDGPADGSAAYRDARIRPGRSKNLRAFNSSWFRKANAEPLNSLVPDFVTSVIAAPPAMPCAASKLFVLMLTVSMVSAGAT